MAETTEKKSGIGHLKELHEKLGKMLDDPQPGLFSWQTALSEVLMEMADYAGHGMLSEIVKKPEFLKLSGH
jgi:hypothetical protein